MSETFTEWAERMGYGLTPFQANLGQRCLDAWADGATVDFLLSKRPNLSALRRALRDYMNGVGDDVTPLGTDTGE